MAMNKKVAQAVEVELKVQNPKDVLPATQVRYSGGILRLEQKVLLSQFRYIYINILLVENHCIELSSNGYVSASIRCSS